MVADRRSFLRTALHAGLGITLSPRVLRLGTLGVGHVGRDAAGEILYNGIRLPDPFPPLLDQPLEVDHLAPYLTDPPSPILIDVGRQLFVDSFLIESMQGCRQVFHQPVPLEGNPLITPRPEETYTIIASGNRYRISLASPYSDGVWWDPLRRKFRAWFCGAFNTLRLAESEDGVTWSRFAGTGGSDIVMQIPSRRDSGTVWIDLDEPDPDRRYKMAFFSMQDFRNRLFVSPNGISWPAEDAPIAMTEPYTADPSIAIGDRTTFYYNPFREKWVWSLRDLYDLRDYGGWMADRIRRYVEGNDLISAAAETGNNTLWLRGGYADSLRPAVPAQVYNLDGFAYESIMCFLYTMYSGPTVVDRPNGLVTPKKNNVHIAFSRDSFYSSRPPAETREPFIPLGDEDTWNEGNVQSVAGGCLVVGPREAEELLFFHSGMHYDFDESGDILGQIQMGGVRLRRDGFASIDSEADEGVLTTRPVQFSSDPGYVFVNADASAGVLAVELLDENGTVVQGFDRQRCRSVSEDGTRIPVVWTDSPRLIGLSNRPVRFRFFLRSARLYSFWVSQSESGTSNGFVGAGGPAYTSYRDDCHLCETPLSTQFAISLSATALGRDVTLSWRTASETNNAGFDIEQQLASGVFQPVGYVGGFGTTKNPHPYSYTVRDLSPGRHVFRLKQIDYDGSFEYSGTVEVTVALPDQYVLEAAYPNPFNPTTTIRFAVPVEQTVTLTLTDSQGRTLRKLWEGTAAANEMHSVRVSSEGLASGVYVARLVGEGFEASESLTLVK